MNFFKRYKTSQLEDASALQLALLEEAERNIYGDAAIWTKDEDTESSKKPTIYANIFDQQQKPETSNYDIDLNNYGTGKSLFPLFDHTLYIFPMWITRDRRFSCINVIGIFITFVFSSFYSLDALTGGQFTGLDADNLEAIGSAYKIIVAGNAVWIPVQIICQVMFHAKYFKIFWTDDKRDNRMIYFIAENKKYRKIHFAMFIYLIIKIGLVSVYTFSAYRYTRDYVYSDFVIGGDAGFIGWQIVKFVFFYIPRSLHGIVIFLYCLEWKFRIRYFWKCKFIEYLHENSLLKRYKKMMNLMQYQLFWIKGWMAADFLAMSIAIWYWLWVWIHYKKHDNSVLLDVIIEGLGYIFYHSMGFVLTWFTASSITAEADNLHKCAFQFLEKLHEQNFTQCFTSDGFDADCEKLVDYHHVDLNTMNDSRDYQKDITGYKESFRGSISMKNRKSTNSKFGKSRNKGNDDQDYEESWKSLMTNKNIIWEEWIYMNNCSVNDIKDEMKRACLIKQLQTFILCYNKTPCVFTLGITIRYATMFKVIILFALAKLVDYLWGFTI